MRYNKCPQCGKPVKEGANRCRYCRARQNAANESNDAQAEKYRPGGWSRWKRDLLILLIPFVLVGGALTVAISINNQKNQERVQKYQRSDADRRAEAERIRAKHKAAHIAEAKKREEETQERAQKRVKETAECNADWQCWGNRHLLHAIVACQPQIERQAQYDYRWTDGWLEPKFSHFRQTEKARVFVYSGDKLQLQNGFGAWQNYIYHCRFNIDAERVEFVKVTPGRL